MTGGSVSGEDRKLLIPLCSGHKPNGKCRLAARPWRRNGVGMRHCETQTYGVHRRQERCGRALVGSVSRGPPREDDTGETQLLLSGN